MIYIVIPVLNRWNYTQACLESLKRQSYRNYRTVVVDHGSTDGTLEKITIKFPEVTVLVGNESMWWSGATNLGVKYVMKMASDEDYVLTLNNDLIVGENFLKVLNDISIINRKALIGSITISSKDRHTITYSGIYWSNIWAKYRNANPILKFKSDLNTLKNEKLNTDTLTGRGTLIPVVCFYEIGFFDEKMFPHYMGDEDFSLRAKGKGYELCISKNAHLYSHIYESGLNLSTTNPRKFVISLFSRKSPINLKRRLFWAMRHSPIGPIYFLIDLLRITFSSIRLMLLK